MMAAEMVVLPSVPHNTFAKLMCFAHTNMRSNLFIYKGILAAGLYIAFLCRNNLGHEIQ